MNRIHEDIRIYTPMFLHENNPSKEDCRAAVSDGGRSVGFHQCNRKGVEEIDGLMFCSQHALEVNRKRGNVEYKHITYVASFTYGKPRLSKVYMLSETDKSFNAIKFEDIIGSIFIISGLNKKGTSHNSSWKYFSDKNDAIRYLINQAHDYVRSTERTHEEAIQTERALLDAWYEKEE